MERPQQSICTIEQGPVGDVSLSASDGAAVGEERQTGQTSRAVYLRVSAECRVRLRACAGRSDKAFPLKAAGFLPTAQRVRKP